MSADTWDVVIGKITSPFGLKGEVKVFPLTDFPERFSELAQAYLGTESDGRMWVIESVRFHKGLVLIKFEGVDDITAADGLRGMEIRIRRGDLVPLEEGRYYIHDIVGLGVLTTDGEDLGKVEQVLTGSANDVYVTPRAMIPAVREFVVSVDLSKKQIVVKAVEGLVQE
ncbi:MAG: 16S rRNA processing protein RimM [Armatimonadetes bacterium]|nr:16S rRNA processing protein RimM [Armatimonadota bacterium]